MTIVIDIFSILLFFTNLIVLFARLGHLDKDGYKEQMKDLMVFKWRKLTLFGKLLAVFSLVWFLPALVLFSMVCLLYEAVCFVIRQAACRIYKDDVPGGD